MRLWDRMARAFSKVLAGHPAYEVTGGEVIFRAGNLLKWNRKNEPGWRVSGVSVPRNSGCQQFGLARGIQFASSRFGGIDSFDFDEQEKAGVVKMNPLSSVVV